jgi:hypothetical protein
MASGTRSRPAFTTGRRYRVAAPLSALRFGYFDHDRIMDVIAVENGRWAVS